MNLERVIEKLATCSILPFDEDDVLACNIAIQVIKEKLERENPQPLGLEELRKMEGEPVWIHWTGRLSHRIDCWKIIKTHDTRGTMWDMNGYGKTWLAYRHKPDIVNANKIEHIGEATNMVEEEE